MAAQQQHSERNGEQQQSPEQQGQQQQGPEQQQRSEQAGSGHGDSARVGAREAARQAISYIDEMTGQPPEVVSGLEREDDGWLVTVELLELARVPDTTDVLGCYQVLIGPDGEPLSYRRLRRYYRGQVSEDRL